MPAKARILTRIGEVEVAPTTALRVLVLDGVRRFGPATSFEIGNWAYYRRKPYSSRLGARWQVNASQWSAVRRAIARLRRQGQIMTVGKAGRATLYAVGDGGRT